jgi:HPt (histidine-containing phosphotransfer) domain-containing protein
MTGREIGTAEADSFQNVVNGLVTIHTDDAMAGPQIAHSPANGHLAVAARSIGTRENVMTATILSGTGPSPIDMVYLARQSGGDQDLEQELLALFADQCVRHLATIRQAGAETGRDAAHTLKGAARAIGAWQVAEAAEQVETALSGTAAPDAVGALATAADQARAAISALLKAA